MRKAQIHTNNTTSPNPSSTEKGRNSSKQIIWKLFLASIIFLIVNSYWLAPFLLNKSQSVINSFDQTHQEAFVTAGDARLGTALNVAALYGFWAERLPWAKYFLWPKDNLYLFLPLFGAILFLVGWGIVNKFKTRVNTPSQSPPHLMGRGLETESNPLPIFLIAGLAGFIFSVGVSDTIFKGLNSWLFEHIWFWSGFRDTQKWSGLLVLAYAYFGAWGAYGILEKINRPKIVNYIIPIIFLVPILYTYTIWGGFSRQLKPVWYPESWHKANQILNQDKDNFKVLFLPWHQYLSLGFNNNLITANPARIFFDKEIIQGQNMELGKIFSQGGDKEYQEIENIILASASAPIGNTLKALYGEGIKYIIFVHDLESIKGEEFFGAQSSNLEKVFDSKELTLYKILL